MSKRTPVAPILLLLSACLRWAPGTQAQNLQLHYDLRHTLQPAANKANFPTFSFEYFKNTDSLNRGSFLLKLQADLTGPRYNAGQVYLQLTQTLRFWQPKVFLALSYTGGLGATPDGYGYYLSNALGTGLAYPFQWKGGWFSASVLYRYSAFAVPSHDPQLMFYFGRGFFHYRLFAAGSLVGWTENRNQGTAPTADLSGKKAAFFADPQLWLSVRKGFSVGTRVNVFYHLLTTDNTVQLYPTLGTKYQF
ncbi:DUF5020 family protein [Hymenobacter ruricola]|uniref:DUF5020 family protein n=1 Tax=Hymenobacter ruricola TaxID=2791023 RepID=A0ABS0I6I8_9BACT|nr:DUF5020 family protein [Hymenobacter ruricola]MBF9222597.1 DUF5020 family protein [Hymenobacter ruricola]